MRYARICPNTNNWTSPSGGKKYCGPRTFPGMNGFGFDEWLLGTPMIKNGEFKGYKAGFIQGFRGQPASFVTDVSCYWIEDHKSKSSNLAIVIEKCQKLSEQEASDIFEEYRRDNFIETMITHLDGLSLAFPAISDSLSVFNVVFKPRDVELITPPCQSSKKHPRFYDLFN